MSDFKDIIDNQKTENSTIKQRVSSWNELTEEQKLSMIKRNNDILRTYVPSRVKDI